MATVPGTVNFYPENKTLRMNDTELDTNMPLPTAPISVSETLDTGESAPMTVIEPAQGWRIIDWVEIWNYRELLFYLTWRDVAVRYKQTALGAAWAVLQPFATMIVFSLFFGRLAEMQSEGIAYPLFVYAGLLPWTFFANAITAASGSIVGSQNLITKVYFPRLIIPMAAMGPALVDFMIAFSVLLLMCFVYGVVPGWTICFVPLLTIALIIAAFGIGTLLSALTVAYRDFRHVIPFSVQLWMFATPTIYMHVTIFESGLRNLLPLNPAYGLIANFRSATLGRAFDFYSLAISLTVAICLAVLGCSYFRRLERTFADII